jgi:hypothetical protein
MTEINKPFWQIKHEWWIEDLNLELNDKDIMVKLLQKHPDDILSAGFRDIIKTIDSRIKRIKQEYKKIYGIYPKI